MSEDAAAPESGPFPGSKPLSRTEIEEARNRQASASHGEPGWSDWEGVSVPVTTEGGFYFADEDAELVAREREQHMAILRGIPDRQTDLYEQERSVVRYARMLGISWDDIAAAIGTTGEAALEQYGEPAPGDMPF